MVAKLVLSCRSSPNIAIVKYWGKKDETLVLPLNSSISITLHPDELSTLTSIYEKINPVDSSDLLVVNGKKQPISTRINNLLCSLRRSCKFEELKNTALVIVSENNFPTASGMASSASGFAAFAFALCKYFKIEEDWSIYARMGSGSACRSMHGGFVLWEAGECSKSSRAVQLFDEHHWEDLVILILIFSSQQKTVSSTSGMQTSVETSELLKERLRLLPSRLEILTKAIKEKDFPTFANVCMRESNQLHAVCMDTYPPIRYLTNESFELIQAVHSFNNFYGQSLACYSFDAGSNAFVFFEKQNRNKLYHWLKKVFPKCALQVDTDAADISNHTTCINDMLVGSSIQQHIPLIETKVGPGPTIVTGAPELVDY